MLQHLTTELKPLTETVTGRVDVVHYDCNFITVTYGCDAGASALDRKARKRFDALQLQSVHAAPQKPGRLSAAIGKGEAPNCLSDHSANADDMFAEIFP